MRCTHGGGGGLKKGDEEKGVVEDEGRDGEGCWRGVTPHCQPNQSCQVSNV